MRKIRQLIDRYISFGPSTCGKTLIEVKCYCDFEGHGRSSETWEEHWEIILPTIVAHWKSTTGWEVTGGDKMARMRFHGRTYADVEHKCEEFLEWLNEDPEEDAGDE
jgi:hypothetical protein